LVLQHNEIFTGFRDHPRFVALVERPSATSVDSGSSWNWRRRIERALEGTL
jgi:hypothetical protein